MSKVLNIAHRGARSIAPENTILAAQKAYEVGADMWELDTGMLKDGTLIVLHDNTFQRTTNIDEIFPDRVDNHLTTFTRQEVSKLDAGCFYQKNDPFHQIQNGAVSSESLKSFNGLPIPTLEEALLFTKERNWQVNVEIKDMKNTFADQKIVQEILNLIQKIKAEDHVLISSFNHQYLAEFHTKQPLIPTAALVAIPKLWDRKLCEKLGVAAYHPPKHLLTQSLIQKFIKKQLSVNIWTVNDPDQMENWIQAGATGIITDFPQILNGILSPVQQ